jgi:glycosyltransferase 2 family protein
VSRRALSLALRLTVSLGLLGLLALVVAEPRELLSRLAEIRPPMLAAAFALTAVDRVLMAFKWWILLRARGIPMPLIAAIRAYFASSFAGLFLPVTLGADAVRLVASRQYGAAGITASIVVERTLGAVSVVVVALTGCAIIAGMLADVAIRRIAWAVGGVGLAVSGGFVVSLWLASRWADRPLRPGESSMSQKLAAAYAAYARHPAALSAFFVLSIVESVIPALVTFLAARGLNLDMPVWVFVAAVPVALMVARLPVSLGGFGVQEASFVYLAGLLGMGRSDAVATMLVVDAVLVLTLLPAAFDVSILRQQRPTT